MSNNQNRGNNQNGNQNQNGAPVNGEQQKEKEELQMRKVTFMQRIMKVRDKVMASKAGRIAIRGLKVAGVGGIAFASYKAGAKSVKPVTVYIEKGVTEEAEEAEAAEPESTSEVTE